MLAEILKHPLFIALVGTSFVSFIFPWLWHRHKGRISERQAKLDIARELINRNLDISTKLNTLLTTLEIFHKDNVSFRKAVTDFTEEQNRLRLTLNAAYVEFDRVAWFWYWYLPRISLDIHISDGEMNKFSDFGKELEKNLIDSANVVNKFWKRCLAENYKPDDPAITEEMESTRSGLERLAEERQSTLMRYLYNFCGK